MSDIKASELIIGADTYEGAFEEENESHQESDGEIAEGDHFSLCSDCTVELDGIMDDVEGRLHSDDPMDVEAGSVENSTDLQNNSGKINGVQSDSDSDTDDDMKPIPRGKSIAHFYMHRRIVYVSLDLEHGGESCGIVQLSCQLFRLRKDTIQSKLVGEVENITFNEFVQPPKDAIWSENACKCHGLSAQHQCIVDADPISVVWKKFIEFLDKNIGPEEKGVLIAWNGESCDLRWLYKIAQSPNSSLSFPSKLDYFFDPLKTIKKYKSCKLNKKHSKIESHSLSAVYKHLFGKDLDNAHDSLADCKAQTQIVLHDVLIHFIDKTHSIRSIDEMLSRREQAELKKKYEPIHPVHEPWEELNERSDSWIPPRSMSYTGFDSGGRHGPSRAVQDIALRKKKQFYPV